MLQKLNYHSLAKESKKTNVCALSSKQSVDCLRVSASKNNTVWQRKHANGGLQRGAKVRMK